VPDCQQALQPGMPAVPQCPTHNAESNQHPTSHRLRAHAHAAANRQPLLCLEPANKQCCRNQAARHSTTLPSRHLSKLHTNIKRPVGRSKCLQPPLKTARQAASACTLHADWHICICCRSAYRCSMYVKCPGMLQPEPVPRTSRITYLPLACIDASCKHR
jgi:hypothetical protein